MKKLSVLLISLLATFALVTAASARDGDVRRAGTCTEGSTSKIKLGPREGEGIETEFEVDQNRNGVVWNVALRQNGQVVFRGRRTTQPPSGSFEVDRTLPNRPGTDHIVGVAVNPATGERCTAGARV